MFNLNLEDEDGVSTDQLADTKTEPTDKKATEAKKPLKNIDDIKKMKEMLALFELLGLPDDSENLNLAQMKKEAKAKIEEQSSGSGQYVNGTTGFRVISKAKKRDVEIRMEFKKMYSAVNECLTEFDEDIISILNSYTEDSDILKSHNERKKCLEKHDYHLILTGETSAGKSTLLNLILGEELLPQDVLHATATICEIKNGEKRLIAHYKPDTKQPPKEISLETSDECGKTCKEQIAEHMFLDQDNRQKGSEFEKVELFWPNDLLQEGVVIIDTPGVGESDDMNEVLMNYLPQAFAFINVIDVSHAGGLQVDHKKKLTKILETMQSLGGDNEDLAKCSLFVGNKWDLIEESDRNKVKKYVAKGLSECWQNESHQIVYISAQQSIQLQQYGGVTSEFQELLQNIKQMILTAINVRLYNHWLWLDFVLYQIFKLTDFFTNEIKSNANERRERGNSLASRIHDIEFKKETLNKDIMESINCETNDFLRILGEYIQSSEFQLKFCSWSDSSVPQKRDTWSITKAKIQTAIEDRLQDFLKQWESETQYHEKRHRKLIDEFLARLNLLEEEIEGGDNTHSVAKQVKYLNSRSQMSTKAKLLVGATSPLWIPAGIAGFVIGMPVVAGLTLKRKLSEKMKLDIYEENPREYLEKQSKKFLAARAEVEKILKKYVTDQMTKTANILSTYFKMIPRLIEADTKMVSQLRKEKRKLHRVWQQYNPIKEKSLQIRKDMLLLGIEVCPVTVDARELEWREDNDSCLGEGEFSLVYLGKLENGGKERSLHSNTNLDVAVKVFKQPFDDLNFRFYLNEETKIRSLHHENVLKFYGAIKMKESHTSKSYKFAFVMKQCKGNLKDLMFKDESLTPGRVRADKFEEAVKVFLKYALDIANGLNYIHEMGLVHRHFKLENVLVNQCGSAMIGDIGIVGTFTESEKSIIYLAPEVLDYRENCTKAADIYSFGIMMWEMWNGIQAFTELMPLDKVTFAEKVVVTGYRPKQDDLMKSCAEPHTVMTSCWVHDPHERLSARKCSEILWQKLSSMLKQKEDQH